MSKYRHELELSLEAVREAAELLRAESRRPDGPRGSGMKAPVDEEIEALLCDRLSAAFPEDHIVSEESGGRKGTNNRAFHIDPHDGTRDFLQGRRETSISLALLEDGIFRMAIVYAPLSVPLLGGSEMLVSWCEGGELLHDGQPVQAPTPKRELDEDSLVLISTRVRGESLAANQRAMAPARLEACASIATRMALVAIGVADVAMTLNHRIQTWDLAGGQALVQAAGGEVVDPDQQPHSWSGRDIELSPRLGYFGARDLALAQNTASRMLPLLKY